MVFTCLSCGVCCVQAVGMTQLLAQVNVTQVLTSATTALITAERVYNATNGLNLTANGGGVRPRQTHGRGGAWVYAQCRDA